MVVSKVEEKLPKIKKLTKQQQIDKLHETVKAVQDNYTDAMRKRSELADKNAGLEARIEKRDEAIKHLKMLLHDSEMQLTELRGYVRHIEEADRNARQDRIDMTPIHTTVGEQRRRFDGGAHMTTDLYNPANRAWGNSIGATKNWWEY